MKIDFKSIKFKLWGYFIGFSVILIALIWILQIFFLDAYYEEMKMRETRKTANNIIQIFRDSQNLDTLSRETKKLISGSDIYLRVETGDGDLIMAPPFDEFTQPMTYSKQINVLRERLLNSKFKDMSTVAPGPEDTRILAYACYLYDAEVNGGSKEDSCVLYLFTPLYPVQSTISILRIQLIYITIIAVLLAVSLALYLANKISKPINDITWAAAEMGKGNYGVQFRGSRFTEIKKLSQTLASASRDLEKTEMYQKDLIANVSHDLKTPLTMIRSYAEMIRDLSGSNPEKRNQHLEVIIEETDRLNLLVNDMLNMSRMQSKNITIDPEEFSLTEITKTLLSSYDIYSEQEGYSFTFNCKHDFMVYADKERIKQVLANLISNAVKYCGQDKKIIIDLKKTGRGVRCEVIDHGNGIAPDEVKHVWNRYYKSSTHHVRPTEGTGLGLSIVKEILVLHNAEYGVESTVGKGSCFWFELPVKKIKKINK